MKLKIERTDVGRYTPRPGRVPDPDRQFGNAVPDAPRFRDAPIQAFGDSRGQIAQAQALANAGNAIMDVAVRTRALQEVADDKKLDAVLTKVGTDEAQIRADVEKEARENGHDAKWMAEEYQKRTKATFSSASDTSFDTISEETLRTQLDARQKKWTLDFNGTIEKKRHEDITNSHLQNHSERTRNAGLNGAASQWDKLPAIISDIRTSFSNPITRALFKDPDAQERKETLEVINSFLRPATINNPKHVLDMLKKADSVISELLPPDILLEAREVATTALITKTERDDTIRRNGQKDDMNKFLLGVETGDPSTTVNAAKRMGLDDDYTLRMVKAVKARDKAARTASAGSTALRTIAAAGGTFAFLDGAKEKRQADAVLDQGQVAIERQGDKTPEEKESEVRDLAVQFVRLPPRIRAQVNNMGISADPNYVAQQYGRMKDLATRAPKLLDELEPEARAVYDLIEGGNTPQIAIETQRRIAQATGPQLDILKTGSMVYADREKAEEFLTSSLNEFFRIDPDDIPSGMISDFHSTFKSSFLSQGNKTIAEKTALMAIKNNWSISNVTSEPKWMRFTPEMQHAVTGQSSEWMKKELKHVAATLGKDFENIFLEDVPQGERGGVRVWYVMDKETGQPIFNENNQPAIFRPNWNDYLARKRGESKEEREFIESQRGNTNDPMEQMRSIRENLIKFQDSQRENE